MGDRDWSVPTSAAEARADATTGLVLAPDSSPPEAKFEAGRSARSTPRDTGMARPGTTEGEDEFGEPFGLTPRPPLTEVAGKAPMRVGVTAASAFRAASVVAFPMPPMRLRMLLESRPEAGRDCNAAVACPLAADPPALRPPGKPVVLGVVFRAGTPVVPGILSARAKASDGVRHGARDQVEKRSLARSRG